MRKFLVVLFFISCFTVVWSQEATAKKAVKEKPTAEEIETKRAELIAQMGGLVQKPAGGPTVVFLNTQRVVAEEVIQGVLDIMLKSSRLKLEMRQEQPEEPMERVQALLRDKEIGAVLLIADMPGQPTILCAPEERWTVINIAALGKDMPTIEVLSERLRKEVWRGFGYLMGAAHSLGGCLLMPVTSLADLDNLKAPTLGLEAYMKIVAQSKHLGMTQSRMTGYRHALEEGWAPEPVNEAQRRIWEEFKRKKAEAETAETEKE